MDHPTFNRGWSVGWLRILHFIFHSTAVSMTSQHQLAKKWNWSVSHPPPNPQWPASFDQVTQLPLENVSVPLDHSDAQWPKHYCITSEPYPIPVCMPKIATIHAQHGQKWPYLKSGFRCHHLGRRMTAVTRLWWPTMRTDHQTVDLTYGLIYVVWAATTRAKIIVKQDYLATIAKNGDHQNWRCNWRWKWVAKKSTTLLTLGMMLRSVIMKWLLHPIYHACSRYCPNPITKPLQAVFKIRSETCRTEAQFIYDKEGKLAGPIQIFACRGSLISPGKPPATIDTPWRHCS